jgi:very-short-patch-repair endonuclease
VPRTDEVLLKRAKAMRSELTQPERELWTALRAKRFENVKFSRQVVIGPYIVDFVARLRKLVIELDGDTHAGNERRDARRTAWLEQQGYRVIRFNNSDVMSNVEGVLQAIGDALGTAPLPNPLLGGERA